MRNKLISIALINLFISCNQDEPTKLSVEDQNLMKVTIGVGLTGTLKERRGNCMPMLDDVQNVVVCSERVIQDTLVIHKLTSWDELIGEAVLYDSVKSPWVAEVISDKEGFYEIPLNPGHYSIFILHNGKHFANGGNAEYVHPVTILEGSLSTFHPILDLAVY